MDEESDVVEVEGPAAEFPHIHAAVRGNSDHISQILFQLASDPEILPRSRKLLYSLRTSFEESHRRFLQPQQAAVVDEEMPTLPGSEVAPKKKGQKRKAVEGEESVEVQPKKKKLNKRQRLASKRLKKAAILGSDPLAPQAQPRAAASNSAAAEDAESGDDAEEDELADMDLDQSLDDDDAEEDDGEDEAEPDFEAEEDELAPPPPPISRKEQAKLDAALAKKQQKENSNKKQANKRTIAPTPIQEEEEGMEEEEEQEEQQFDSPPKKKKARSSAPVASATSAPPPTPVAVVAAAPPTTPPKATQARFETPQGKGKTPRSSPAGDTVPAAAFSTPTPAPAPAPTPAAVAPLPSALRTPAAVPPSTSKKSIRIDLSANKVRSFRRWSREEITVETSTLLTKSPTASLIKPASLEYFIKHNKNGRELAERQKRLAHNLDEAAGEEGEQKEKHSSPRAKAADYFFQE